MSYILLTNDDGVDSPALVPFAKALQKRAPLKVVVPAGERSWVGHAVSRFSEMRVETVDRSGVEMVTVDGYPADAANLGVHRLFDAPPRLVVSGINIGLNVGQGFFYSSGTVGAAMEGWIGGLPAVACSTGVWARDSDWKKSATSPERVADWERAAELSADIAATIWDEGLAAGVDLLNVNFEIGTPLDAPRELTRLAPPGYASLHEQVRPGVYAYSLERSTRKQDLPGTDVAAVANGRVSITPVNFGATTPLDDAMQRKLRIEGA